MRYALAITGTALLFALGFVLAACGSASSSPTTTTPFKPGPRPSIVHPVPYADTVAPDTTRTTITTIGYLGTNGRESTQAFTYTTTEPKSSITFTQTGP